MEERRWRPRSPLLNQNKQLQHLETHHLHPPRGWYTYVSHGRMEVYYYDANTGTLQWDFPSDYLLAPMWKRKLSTDNVEHFVEERGYAENWYKEPRNRNDPTGDRDTSATLYEDSEHYDEGKTQYIHQAIEQLKHAFPDTRDVATGMLHRFTNRPPSSPLCFLPRRNEAEHIDYDLASYIMQCTPAPEGSQPTIRHLLHRL